MAVTPTVDGLIDEILKHAAGWAANAQRTDPRAELKAWLGEARERETMVVVGYSERYVKPHLKGLAKRGFKPDFVRDVDRVIREIWSQEHQHAAWLRREPVVSFAKDLQMDVLEGAARDAKGALGPSVMTGLADRGASRAKQWWARLVRAAAAGLPFLGKRMKFPPFLKNLRQGYDLGMSGFCLVNKALETTAVQGYERILQLLRELDATDDDLMLTADYQVAVTLRHERWHESVFDVLARDCGDDPPGGSAHASAKELRSTVKMLRSHIFATVDAFLGVRADPTSNVWSTLGSLEEKWSDIISGRKFLDLGLAEEGVLSPSQYIVFIDPGQMYRFAPPDFQFAKCRINPSQYPTLAKVCEALGKRSAEARVSWHQDLPIPAGMRLAEPDHSDDDDHKLDTKPSLIPA